MIHCQTLCLLLCVVGGDFCIVDIRRGLKSVPKPTVGKPLEPAALNLEPILSKLKNTEDLSSLDKSAKQLIRRLELNVNAWIPKRVVYEVNEEGTEEATFIDYNAKVVRNYSIDPSTKLSKIVVELDIKEESRFCLLVWKYVHAKYISKFMTLEEAGDLMGQPFDVTKPLWVTLPSPYETIYNFAREENPDVDESILEKLIPEKFLQEGFEPMYLWKSSGFDSEFNHMRCIAMVKYQKKEDIHSHYMFISTLVNKAGEFRVNFAGGITSTQELAEFSVLNFMMLPDEFTHGSWTDYEAKDVTWSPMEYTLEGVVKEPKAREAIHKDFLDVLLNKQSQIVAGIPFIPLAEPMKVRYFIGLSNADLTCPARDPEILEYVSHSVNYIFLKAQFKSREGGIHAAVTFITSIDEEYVAHGSTKYEGYVNPGDVETKRQEGKYFFNNW